MSTNGISGDWFEQPTAQQSQQQSARPAFSSANELIGQVFKGFTITGRLHGDYIDRRGQSVPKLAATCDCGAKFSLLPFIAPSCVGCRTCTEVMFAVGAHLGDFVISRQTEKQNTKGRMVPALLLNCRTCHRAVTRSVHNVVQSWRQNKEDTCHACRGYSV